MTPYRQNFAPTLSSPLDAFIKCLESIDDVEVEDSYTNFLIAGLPEYTRKQLEDILDGTQIRIPGPSYASRHYNRGRAEGETQGVALGQALGEARGEAKSIIAVLTERGIEVPEATRDRIMDCKDTYLLDVWLRQAIIATSIDDLDLDA
ncbi:hypothetical protein ACFOVU_02705 [Nocardiopsis sediminis]|uniref:Uncharacterized protein n=1 Tax=Nocardiopsis sediminis TaxID=1778267 RepID=A0ABV8FFA5_9ACTN